MSVPPTRFSAIVLAAGTASRMRGEHKMLLPVGDEPAVRRTVRNVLAAEPREVVVVSGFNGHAVGEAVRDLPVRLQANPRYEEGQMTSVAVGLAALTEPTDAVMVCLGDMVLVTPADYRDLVSAFATRVDKSIVVPRYNGQRGNPVLFAALHVPEIIAGEGNIDCRKLIADNPHKVFVYESTHDRFVSDMDTPEDYARIVDRLSVHHMDDG